ncbi:hypothetical protein NUM3379_43380 [Kineococcus sp. NUM-3379]
MAVTARNSLPVAVLGVLLVLAGAVFHSAAAYRAANRDQTASWPEFLEWGAIRWAAWAALAGGAWLVVLARGARRGTGTGEA